MSIKILVILIAIAILPIKCKFSRGGNRRQSQNESSVSPPPCPQNSPVPIFQGNCSIEPPPVKELPPPVEPSPPDDPPPVPLDPPPPPPPDLVPLGWDKILLLMVPQVKIPIRQSAKWWKSSVKMSFPINVFFDKLVVPRDSPPLIFFPFGTFHGPEGRRKRRSSNSPILSLPPPESVRGGERATLIPRLEMLLESYGLEGKGCLLRTLCEIHETSLTQAYGLFGEILTLLFTVSNSAYGESHLPEYLKAEEMGRAGRCFLYYKNCQHSLFHNEDEMFSENFI